MRSVQDIESAFMRMDVNGDGSLTKREMLAADEFTPEEVRREEGGWHWHKYFSGSFSPPVWRLLFVSVTASQSTKYRIFLSNYNYLQIEAIFDLGDVDGDGTIDMDEFVGKNWSPESNN